MTTLDVAPRCDGCQTTADVTRDHFGTWVCAPCRQRSALAASAIATVLQALIAGADPARQDEAATAA